MAPIPFVDVVTYREKSSFISTLLIYILEYIYITLINNILLFLNILLDRTHYLLLQVKVL
jgi:hypothetical protein